MKMDGQEESQNVEDVRGSSGGFRPDTFTHGTGAQRVAWFKRGVASGQIDGCDTFSAQSL